jgi:hypothetical protein
VDGLLELTHGSSELCTVLLGSRSCASRIAKRWQSRYVGRSTLNAAKSNGSAVRQCAVKFRVTIARATSSGYLRDLGNTYHPKLGFLSGMRNWLAD